MGPLGADRVEAGAIGVYFAFVGHPFADLTAAEARRLLASEYGVVTIPGAFFGSGLQRYLRVAFANAGVGQIADAADSVRVASGRAAEA